MKKQIESFLQESEFADGLQVNNHVVSVKIDANSEQDSQATPADFLTVSSNGIKVSGIKDEIDRKIAALDVTGDTAVAGQYVAAIEETDGIVAVKTRANVSEAVLNNYSKGSDATAVAATDTVNQAISKLENQVDKAKAEAKTKVEKDANAAHLTLTATTSTTDNSVTYTIGETDIASASALTELSAATQQIESNLGLEIARAQSAETILQSTINEEISARTNGDRALSDAIDAEETRATSAETILNNAISAETVRATSAETVLNEALQAEVTRATSAETVLNEALAAETVRATSAETVLQQQIDALDAVEYNTLTLQQKSLTGSTSQVVEISITELSTGGALDVEVDSTTGEIILSAGTF